MSDVERPKSIDEMSHDEAVAKKAKIVDFFGEDKIKMIYDHAEDFGEGGQDTVAVFVLSQLNSLDQRILETQPVPAASSPHFSELGELALAATG